MRSAHPTDQSAGTGPRVVIVFSCDGSRHDRESVTSCPLDQSMSACREIVDEFGMQQVKILEIDHIEVSALSDLKRTSVAKPIHRSSFECLHSHRGLEGKLRAA